MTHLTRELQSPEARIDDHLIGARLQAARKALWLTQSDVGEKMGMVTSTVSAI